MGKLTLHLGSVALLLLSACGGSSDAPEQGQGGAGGTFACTAEARAGIAIQVIDAVSGKPIACGAHAVVTAGTYSESVDKPAIAGCSDGDPLGAAYERPGTYAITVSKSGYRDFTIKDVVVAADVCHVTTVTVEARLSSL